jgi:peroxiredoxin
MSQQPDQPDQHGQHAEHTEHTAHHPRGRSTGGPGLPPRRGLTVGVAVALLVAVLAALGIFVGGGQEATSTTPQLSPAGPATIAVDSELLDEISTTPLQAGEEAPDFRYTLADGTSSTLSDLRGQKVILNFWASWCAPCVHEMPAIQEVSNEHGDELVVLAVNRDEQVEQIEAFAEELGLSITLIANTESDITDRYGASGLPTTYFINTDGTIAYRHIGVMDKPFIEERVEALQ